MFSFHCHCYWCICLEFSFFSASLSLLLMVFCFCIFFFCFNVTLLVFLCFLILFSHYNNTPFMRKFSQSTEQAKQKQASQTSSWDTSRCPQVSVPSASPSWASVPTEVLVSCGKPWRHRLHSDDDSPSLGIMCRTVGMLTGIG